MTEESCQTATNADPYIVALDAQSDIKDIATLKEQLVEARESDLDIVIDASGVESIDTAALQLLHAFTNSLRTESRKMTWFDISDAFKAMSDLADFSRTFGLDGSADESLDDSLNESEDTDNEGEGLCPVF